jgi:hypothetical protein
MSFVRKAIEKTAAENNEVDLLIADSMNDQVKQNDQIDAYINKGVKALCINLVDPAAGETVVEKARKAGIPIIFYNKEPAKDVIMGYDKCWYAGITSAEFGIQQGHMIVDAWKANPSWDKNSDGAIQYVLLKGEPGHPDAEVRTTEPIRIIKEAGIKADELELQTGMWDAAKGKDLMQTWLAKHGDDIDISQVEGFIRQIIGWREYMRGIYWKEMPEYANLNKLENHNPLPDFFWTGKTKMNCLSHAIGQSLTDAYAHHIQRLMIIGNYALLTQVNPDEVDNWL